MNRSTLCHAVALAFGGVALAAVTPAGAVKVVSATAQLPIQIIGADSFCASWTAGTDGATGAPTLTCVPVNAGTGGTAPTGCSATINGAASATLASSAGGAVTLAASCTTPATGVTYAWTRNGAASATTATWTDTLPANSSTTAASTTSYEVQACSGTACVTLPSTPLTAVVPAATPPAGGGGGAGGGGTTAGAWNGACPGFNKTIHIVANWATPTRMLTAAQGGFSANDIVVYEFTTGSGSSADNNLPRVAGAEYGGGAANRIAALSDTPCDFVGLPYYAATMVSSAPTIPFTVNNPNNWGYYPVLHNNTTYYLNVKLSPGSGCTTSCDMFFDLSKNGTP